MEEKAKKQPDIRFKGFSDDWQQKKVGDIAERYDNLRIPVAKNLRKPGNIPYYGANGIQDYVEGYTHDGEFILVAEDGANDLENYPVNYINGRVWVNNHAHVIQAKQDCLTDNKFLGYAVGMADIKSFLVGGSRAKLNAEQLMNIDLLVPQKCEQQKIGEFFATLDKLINLHRQELDLLKKAKRTLLAKMFPQKGEKVPQLRFKGFTDDWQRKKLGEVLSIAIRKNGDLYTKKDVLSVSDEFGCVNQIEFQGRSFAAEDVSNYKIVESDDIVYTRSPLQAKPYGIIKLVGNETGIVSPLYIVNVAVKGNYSKFIYYNFDTPQKTNNYLSPLVRKGAKNTMNISNGEWLSGDIFIAPSYGEQQKIGEFFATLDKLINLRQRGLDSLKTMKKSLLKAMFI